MTADKTGSENATAVLLALIMSSVRIPRSSDARKSSILSAKGRSNVKYWREKGGRRKSTGGTGGGRRRSGPCAGQRLQLVMETDLDHPHRAQKLLKNLGSLIGLYERRRRGQPDGLGGKILARGAHKCHRLVTKLDARLHRPRLDRDDEEEEANPGERTRPCSLRGIQGAWSVANDGSEAERRGRTDLETEEQGAERDLRDSGRYTGRPHALRERVRGETVRAPVQGSSAGGRVGRTQ